MYLNLRTNWSFTDSDWQGLAVVCTKLLESAGAQKRLKQESIALFTPASPVMKQSLSYIDFIEIGNKTREFRLLRAPDTQHYPELSTASWMMLLGCVMLAEAWQHNRAEHAQFELGEPSGIVPKIRDTYQLADDLVSMHYPSWSLLPYESYLDRYKLRFNGGNRRNRAIHNVLAAHL